MSEVREGTLVADKYRLERALGRGGMGSVWVARHLTLDMQVAVKFMDPALAATVEWRARFEREARAIAAIQSRNVVHVHDYGVHEGTPYMAMELLKGEELGARLAREHRLSPRATAALLTQVGRALRHVHELGIVHRDLKPSNILLCREDDDEVVKVVDFGVAKRIGPGSASETTHTGVVMGSVHYMSPEQARGARDVDHRSDLWSMAVIAYRALTGYLPFPGDQMGDVIAKIVSESAWPPSSFAPELGPTVDAFFVRAFARRPDERYQSARELTDTFTAMVHGLPPSVASWISPPSPPSIPLPQFSMGPQAAPNPARAMPAQFSMGPQAAPNPARAMPAQFSMGPVPTAVLPPPISFGTPPALPAAPITGTITNATQARDLHTASRRSVLAATGAMGALVIAGVAVLTIRSMHSAPDTPLSQSAEGATASSARVANEPHEPLATAEPRAAEPPAPTVQPAPAEPVTIGPQAAPNPGPAEPGPPASASAPPPTSTAAPAPTTKAARDPGAAPKHPADGVESAPKAAPRKRINKELGF